MAIFFNFSPTSNHRHSLQVENCDSNSRLVVDGDDSGKLRLERVDICMWSRRLSNKMVIDEADFVKCFVLALTNGEVVNKIDNVISASLRMDITKLTESNEKLSIELSTSREMHTETTKQVNQLKTSLEKKDEEITALRTALPQKKQFENIWSHGK